MSEALEPLAPSKAKEMFLAERRGQVADRTVQVDDYRLPLFIRWTEENAIDNLNYLTGRRLHEFRLWRKEDGDLNKVSLRTQLKSLRVFIKWCESIDAVEPQTNVFLHVGLYPTRTKMATKLFLTERNEKHNLVDAEFVVDGDPGLQAGLLELAVQYRHEFHGDRNPAECTFQEIKRRTNQLYNNSPNADPSTIES